MSFPRRIDTPDTKIHPRINKELDASAYYSLRRILSFITHSEIRSSRVTPCFKTIHSKNRSIGCPRRLYFILSNRHYSHSICLPASSSRYVNDTDNSDERIKEPGAGGRDASS